MVRLTDCPDMTLDVYHGHKRQHNNNDREIDRLPGACGAEPLLTSVTSMT